MKWTATADSSGRRRSRNGKSRSGSTTMKKICAFKHRKNPKYVPSLFFSFLSCRSSFCICLVIIWAIYSSFWHSSVIFGPFVNFCHVFVVRHVLAIRRPLPMAQGGASEKQLPAAWVLFLVGSQARCKKNKRKKQTKEKVARASKILEKKASSKNKAEEKTSCKSTQDMQEESTGQEQTLESNKKKQDARGRSGGKTKIWKKKASCKNKDESRPGSCSLNYCLGGRKAAIWSIISESYVSHNGLQVAGLFWPSLAWCFGVAKLAFWRPEGCDLEL